MKTERHGYKFTNKHNTSGGIISVVCACTAIIALIVGIVVSYKNSGNAGTIVGALGSLAFFAATLGLVLGLKSFKEKDKFYMFSWIGTIANGVLWLGMCAIITVGFMLW